MSELYLLQKVNQPFVTWHLKKCETLQGQLKRVSQKGTVWCWVQYVL